MTDQSVKFGLTLPNRGVITGATTVEEMLVLLRLTGYDQEKQFKRVTEEVLSAFL
jgi:hypothetical protein